MTSCTKVQIAKSEYTGRLQSSWTSHELVNSWSGQPAGAAGKSLHCNSKTGQE